MRKPFLLTVCLLSIVLLLSCGVWYYMGHGYDFDNRSYKSPLIEPTVPPHCTQKQRDLYTQAAPLQRQMKDLNAQAAELARRHINGIVDNWKHEPEEKVEYDRQRQVIDDQIAPLNAQVQSLIGGIYCS